MVGYGVKELLGEGSNRRSMGSVGPKFFPRVRRSKQERGSQTETTGQTGPQ